MHKKFNELRQKLSPDAQDKVAALVKKMKSEMHLNGLDHPSGLPEDTFDDHLDIKHNDIESSDNCTG